MKKTDLVTAEIVRGAFTYAAEEMGIALRKSAYSPNIKDRMDHSCAVFDADKRLVAQAEHIPVHLGSLPFGVNESLRVFKGNLEPGDMIIVNDPYISGTHLPDISLIRPVFYEGDIVAYTANKAHHSDVGGKAPGSMTGDSIDLYQEGLIIPPVKIMEHNEIDDNILTIILNNVRTPDVRAGDLRAQIAANLLGERQVLATIKKYGLEKIQESADAILDHSEAMQRREIDQMPEGTFEGEDYLDDTGVSDEPARIHVSVTVNRDELRIDYAGTTRQVEGPINAVWGVTLSGVYYVLKCITDLSIPINEGCFRPVTITAPKGTILNPIRPAPVAGGNVETSQRNADALFRAFAKMMPEKICAGCQGTMNNVTVGGFDPKTGALWSMYETIAGGFGGRYGLDGIDGIHSHMTNTLNTPIEAVEGTHPLHFISYSFRKDTGGLGKWRGGMGVERSWIINAPSAIVSVIGDRKKFRPWGLQGGREGAPSEYLVKKTDGAIINLGTKKTLKISKGDMLIVRTPGAGGYGDPFERDPALVLQDVLNDAVSVDAARKDYGVIIQENEVNTEATMDLRAKLKKS